MDGSFRSRLRCADCARGRARSRRRRPQSRPYFSAQGGIRLTVRRRSLGGSALSISRTWQMTAPGTGPPSWSATPRSRRWPPRSRRRGLAMGSWLRSRECRNRQDAPARRGARHCRGSRAGRACCAGGRAGARVRLRRRPPAVRASARQVLGGGAGRPASGAAALAAPLFDQSQLRLGDGASGDASFPTLHGLYWLAANIALRRPLLVAVDDLHWADAVSLRWLGYLARRLEGLPLLLVLATRPRSEGDEKAMLDELLADPAGVVVRPGPLGTAAVAVLIRDVLSAEPEEAFVAAAETASGGNPCFCGRSWTRRTRAARSDGRERHQGAPDRPGGRPTGPICPALTPARAGPRASARRRDPR